MNEIYPTEKSRHALTVFQLYEGNGEWFDLSKKPIERISFTIGDRKKYMDMRLQRNVSDVKPVKPYVLRIASTLRLCRR